MRNSVNKDMKYLKLTLSSDSRAKFSMKWIATIVIWSFALSVIMSGVANAAMQGVSLWVAFFVLLGIILLGILFDIVGVAVAAAAEAPFHSLAARNVAGAREGFFFIKHAEKVSSFCNDVIGDIAGIISGAGSAVIASAIGAHFGGAGATVAALLASGIVASLTIGGKALGKTYALSHANQIVYRVGLWVHYIRKPFVKPKRKKKR